MSSVYINHQLILPAKKPKCFILNAARSSDELRLLAVIVFRRCLLSRVRLRVCARPAGVTSVLLLCCALLGAGSALTTRTFLKAPDKERIRLTCLAALPYEVDDLATVYFSSLCIARLGIAHGDAAVRKKKILNIYVTVNIIFFEINLFDLNQF